MEEQHPKGEVTCPWCKITFEGERCPQCGWAPSMIRCPDCGTFYKGETCPQCEKRREEEEAENESDEEFDEELEEEFDDEQKDESDDESEQNIGMRFMFFVYCFFSVSLFLLFLLPVMKIDFGFGNAYFSYKKPYSLYKFISVFSNYGIRWSDDAKAIYGCCIATLVVACISVLISVYSIAKATTSHIIKPSNAMIFVCLMFILISIIMMFISISAIDKSTKIGAFPIVLLIISIVLLIAHSIVAIHNSSNNGTDSKANTSAT